MTDNAAKSVLCGSEHIKAAIALALKAEDMPAAASLMRMLAVRDPDEAEFIAGLVNRLASREQGS